MRGAGIVFLALLILLFIAAIGLAMWWNAYHQRAAVKTQAAETRRLATPWTAYSIPYPADTSDWTGGGPHKYTAAGWEVGVERRTDTGDRLEHQFIDRIPVDDVPGLFAKRGEAEALAEVLNGGDSRVS